MQIVNLYFNAVAGETGACDYYTFKRADGEGGRRAGEGARQSNKQPSDKI